jgi:hypothetical protein
MTVAIAEFVIRITRGRDQLTYGCGNTLIIDEPIVILVCFGVGLWGCCVRG